MTCTRAPLALCIICGIIATGTFGAQAQDAAEAEPGQTITVAGQVLDPNGRPVAATEVLVQYRKPGYKDATERLVADAEGSFSLTCEVLKLKRPVHVAARKPGLALAWAAVKPGDRVTLKLGKDAATFAGTIKDAEGKPIVGAEVYLHCLRRVLDGKPTTKLFSDDPGFEELLTRYFFPQDEAFLSARTDETGRFEIAGLPPKEQIRFAVEAEGRERWSIEDKTVAIEDDLKITLRREAIISGRVTRNGEPVAGVELWCQPREPMRPRSAGAVSAEDGTYTFSKLSPGLWQVRVVPPEGLTAMHPEPVELAPGQHVRDVGIGLTPGGLVKGVVTDDETYEPVAQVSIHARGENSDASAQTDEKGEYTLRLPPGSFDISCRPWASDPYRSPSPEKRVVEVVEGQAVEDVDFVVLPRRGLRGKVVDANGQPVEGVKVGTTGASATGEFAGHFKVDSDAQGSFEMKAEGVNRHNVWAVIACHPERGLAGFVLFEADYVPKEPITLEVSTGAYLLARIVDTDGEPVPDVPTGVGLSLAGTGYWNSVRGNPTDKDGRVRVGPLPAGIDAHLTPAGKSNKLEVKPVWEKIRIEPGGEHEVKPIVLNLKGRSLAGAVEDDEHRPVERAIVGVSGLDTAVQTDGKGRFEVTGLPAAGRLWVVAVHPTKPLAIAEEADPDRARELDLVLRPTGSATGWVFDNDGVPVEGARLRGYPEFPITVPGGGATFGSYHWKHEVARRLGQHDYFMRVETDEHGLWRADGLIGGARYVFWIELPDGTDARRRSEFAAEPDGEVDAGEVSVDAGD